MVEGLEGRLWRSSRLQNFIKVVIEILEEVGVVYVNKVCCFPRGRTIYL